MANLDLIEQLIKDSTQKELISDGVLTLGELHADRACLFMNLVELLSTVYTLKKIKVQFWHSDSTIEGYSHFGLDISSPKIIVGGLFSNILLQRFKDLDSVHLESPKSYQPLNETLKLFNY